MLYRVVKRHEFRTQTGAQVIEPGQLVDVLTKDDARALLGAGIIADRKISHNNGIRYSVPAKTLTRTLRVGIWLFTSAHYSGGRIHMYQYAWTLASLGAEVFMITNRAPRWMSDYPECPRFRLILDDKVPPDLDVIVTDSKGDYGRKAMQYSKRNPRLPFFCMNFETPNWVAEFEPEYAQKLNVPKDVFLEASHLLANSGESLKYLHAWLGGDRRPGFVLPPAVNTFALNRSKEPGPMLSTSPNVAAISAGHAQRPYALWSARNAQYKCPRLAVDAVWSLDVPFDLVTFGQMREKPESTDLHRLITLENHGDVEKFKCMANAHFVMAPSRFEGYGMVPAESMAAGTPVIVYDLPVLRQEYGEPKGMHYIEWGNERAFKEKVKELAALPKGEVGQPAIASKHGLSAMAQKVESMPYHAVKRKRISVQLITYWGFVPESVESVYPYVDEIFIAYGPTELVKKRGVSDDGTLARLKDLKDPDGKIKIEYRESWADKLQMREWCALQATGNHMLLLDGDEIWTGLDKWIEADVPFGTPRWLTLWHDLDHWIYDSAELAGTRWGRRLDPYGSTCPHYRWSWWRPSYRFIRHHTPADAAGDPLWIRNGEAAKACSDCCIYHLGHSLPKPVMEAKHQFYLDRDGNDVGRRLRRDAWHSWNGQVGDIGDGIVSKVDWTIPEIVTRAYARLQEGGDDGSATS